MITNLFTLNVYQIQHARQSRRLSGFIFYGVFAMGNVKDGSPVVFETWNGKEAALIMDEDGNIEGITRREEALQSGEFHTPC